MTISSPPVPKPEALRLSGNVIFACPSCGHSLQVSRERAHESGPCPVCGAFVASPLRGEDASPRGGRTVQPSVPLRRESRSFVAHRMIMPGPEVELDESWKERYETDLKAWRKRKDFEKKVSDFFASRFWHRTKIIGLTSLMVILAGALVFVYSEKKISGQGIFDAFKKVENPF